MRTGAAQAQPLAIAIDRAQLPEAVGTIAGDDTVLIIAKDDRRAASLAKRLGGYCGTVTLRSAGIRRKTIVGADRREDRAGAPRRSPATAVSRPRSHDVERRPKDNNNQTHPAHDESRAHPSVVRPLRFRRLTQRRSSGASFSFDRRSSKTTSPAAGAWARALSPRRRAGQSMTRQRARRGARRSSCRSPSGSVLCQRARRRRPQLCRAAARRTAWRRRAASAHRAVEERAGLGRSPPLSAAPHPRLAAPGATGRLGACGPRHRTQKTR